MQSNPFLWKKKLYMKWMRWMLLLELRGCFSAALIPAFDSYSTSMHLWNLITLFSSQALKSECASEHYQSHFNYLFWEKAKQLAISWSVFAARSMSRCTYSLPSLTWAQIKYGGRWKTSGGSCSMAECFCLQMWTGSSADLHWRIIGVVMTGDSKASNGRVKLLESDEWRLHNENSCL